MTCLRSGSVGVTDSVTLLLPIKSTQDSIPFETFKPQKETLDNENHDLRAGFLFIIIGHAVL